MDDKNQEQKPKTPERIDLREFEGADLSEKNSEENPLKGTVERAFDRKNEEQISQEIKETKTPTEIAEPGSIVTQSQMQALKEKKSKEIESILEEGLANLYINMSREGQERFKKAGEEASQVINDLLEKGRYTARKIMDIIKKWLSLMPGVNSFFLEQEAKIKTDKILKLQNKYE